jgi:hypothetical protein
MRKIWLALAVLLATALSAQFPFVVAAQTHGAEDAETTAIRRVVDLYMSTDAEKIRSALYPVANLYSGNAQTDLRVIPLEQFLANVAKGAASGAARPKISVDFIDRAGNAAVVKLTELFDAATVTDYFSLVRSNTGWKVVSKSFDVGRRSETSSTAAPNNAHTLDQNHCKSTEVRAFDFMVGDWMSSTSELMTDVGAHGTGVNHIEKVLGRCVLLQHRQEEREGKQLFDAYAISHLMRHAAKCASLLLTTVTLRFMTESGRAAGGRFIESGQAILERSGYFELNMSQRQRNYANS